LLYASSEVLNAQALVSKDPAVVSALQKEELKKAPALLEVPFVQQAEAANGASTSSSLPAVDKSLGRSSSNPLQVEANQPLPIVCVRPLNGAKALVCDWLYSKTLQRLHVEQSVNYAEATPGAAISAASYDQPPPAADGTAYVAVMAALDGPEGLTKGYHFNNGDASRLTFWKAGMYRLTYRLAPQVGGKDLTADLFILVAPALVAHLSCDLAPPHDSRSVRLGECFKPPNAKLKGLYGLQIRVQFLGGAGEFANTRLVSTTELNEMLETPAGGEFIVKYPRELLSHVDLGTGVVSLRAADGKKMPKGMNGGCTLFVGLKTDDVDVPRPDHLGEGRLTAGLWPSAVALREGIFYRHRAHTVTLKVALNHISGVTSSQPTGSVKVPIVSAAPLRLRLARTPTPPDTSLPSTTDGPVWMHASAAEALAVTAPLGNRAPLPAKIALALRDDFECTLPPGVVIHLSAACVAPNPPNAPATAAAACPGLEGATAVVNASGVAVFKKLTPLLSSFNVIAEGGGAVRGALVCLRFTAAIGSEDSEAMPATPQDAEALAAEAEELSRLQVDRFVFLSASRVPAALQLSRGGQPLRADRAGMLLLTGCAGGTVADVEVTILNEVGDALSWDEADRAGSLALDGKKLDGRRPLTGLKLPSSIDDEASCRLAFTHKQEVAGGAATLEAHLVLRPEPGQPAKWLVRRSGAPAAAPTGRRAASGPLELGVGQSLRDVFTIALVDDKENVCRRAGLPRGVVPVLSVRSGSDAEGPWLVRGGLVGAGGSGGARPAQIRELALEALGAGGGGDAVWQVAARAHAHVSLFGPASTNDNPEEMLVVKDAQGAYVEGSLYFKLLAGPPHLLELEPRSKTALCSRDLRTRERFPQLVFVVTDAASNPVPVNSLKIKHLAAAAPALVRVTHTPGMAPEGNSGTRWSLREVRLIAHRDSHGETANSSAGAASTSAGSSAAAGRLSHELGFSPAPTVKTADDSSYTLHCAPLQVATRIRDEFVVDIVCGSGNPAVGAAGMALHPLKLSLRMEGLHLQLGRDAAAQCVERAHGGESGAGGGQNYDVSHDLAEPRLCHL
jgi:hypothetical protein